jgi:hypothetical protein
MARRGPPPAFVRDRHEAGACRVGRRTDECDDRVPGRPCVPRGQGIALSARPPGEAERGRPAEHEAREFAPAELHPGWANVPPQASEMLIPARSIEKLKPTWRPCRRSTTPLALESCATVLPPATDKPAPIAE